MSSFLKKFFLYLQIIRKIIRSKYWNFMMNTQGDLRVNGSISVIKPENVTIGKRSTLNQGVFLSAGAKISIGDDVHISPYVIINAQGLSYGKNNQEHFKKEVIIEDGVWIASGVIINPGVKIGHHAVVGAGAVVTKDVAPNMLAVGVPARDLKSVN